MRNSCFFHVFFILYGISSSNCIAQNPQVLTVEQCVSLALDHSMRLRIEATKVKETAAAWESTKAERLPQIQGEASYMRLSDNIPNVDFTVPGMDTTYTFLPVEQNQFYSSLSLRQPLFAWGSLNREVESAAHLADAALHSEQQARSDVAFSVRLAYWNLYQAMLEQEAIAAALQSVVGHLEVVRSRVEEGVLLKTDLLTAEARHSEILLEQVESRNKLKTARLELKRLIGIPVGSDIQLNYPVEHVEAPLSKEDLMDHVLSSRPELLSVSKQVEARDATVLASQSGNLPNIDLVARYIYARPNQYFFAEQDQFRATWEAGVSMRWNLWSGGKRIYATRQAVARLEGTEAELADLKEQLVMEVEKLYLELERAAEATRASAAHVDSAREAFQVTNIQFDEGMVLSAQVLDAEQALRRASFLFARAMADHEVAHAALLNIMGKIWDDGSGSK